MKASHGNPRRVTTRVAAVLGASTLAFAPCAHAINATWMGGASDGWDSANWDVGGTGIGTALLNSNDERIYDLYFGSGGYHDVNGIVTTTNSKSPTSLNFSQQNWTLNVDAIGTGATATALYMNVNHTSPEVIVNSTYGVTWGNGLGPKYFDMTVDNGSVLTLNANVYGSGSLNKYGGGTAVINTPDHQASVGASGTNVFAGTLITDNPTNDYNVQGSATMNFNIRPRTWLGTRGDLTYTGNVYGAGNFVKSGGATLTMTSDIYYTGSTTVEGGRLVVATFHNPYVTSGFTFNGGDLELRTGTSHQTYGNIVSGTGSFTKSGSYNLTLTSRWNRADGGVSVTGGRLIETYPMSGGSYNLSSGANLTWVGGEMFGSTISGAGSFTKAGNDVVTFTNPNTYTGGTSITEGTLDDWHPHGDYGISSGATLVLSSATYATYGGRISGAGELLKNGYGTLTLTGDYSGLPADYRTGRIRVISGRLIDQHPRGNYLIDYLDPEDPEQSPAELEFANAVDVYFGDASYSSPGAVGGTISGPGNFTKSGVGNLDLLTRLTYTGKTTIQEGRIIPLVSDALPTGTALTVNAPGIFLTAYGISQTVDTLAGTGNVNLSTNSTLTLASAASATFSGVISNNAPASLIKNGPGTQTLSGENTYTGGTFVNGGRLIDHYPHDSYTLANGADLDFANTAPSALSGMISGAGNLTKSGAGNLDLSAPNTYTGSTLINDGRLIVSNTSATSGYHIPSGTTLELKVSDALINNSAPGTTTFTGTGIIEKTGAGRLQWGVRTASFSMAGGSIIRVLEGSLIGGSNADEVWTNNKADLYVASNATFDGVEATSIANGGIFVDAITGGGTIKVGIGGSYANKITFGVDNGSGTFDGILADSSGPGNFVKSGTGTQTLTGQNTYTGDTLVSGGTLTLASGGALRIKVGANGVSNKLTGSGTLRLDGTLVLDLTAAGNSPGDSWTLVNTSTLAETYGSTFALASTRGAFTKRASKWTKVENGVTYEFEPGTGLLTVAPLTGYSLWASLHADNQTEDQDYNHDGVENGIAYFMNNTGVITLPGIVGGKITWQNGGTLAVTAYGTEFKVQTSPDLASWADIPTGDAKLTNLAASVAYTLPTGQGKRFVRLCVTPN
ncbi:autotransporter-associated beta strand repeat-containing protein [Luteolibacter luteus]|uniref:Autotransporter-associated beta strand protein n=1 Tax=Luteolibacter luteus TaxID=2728835 RepID=A0A858RN91_9BACT|nr:autotransporter-associated beta strand repeat-containing protein [Luteolibacter luteus]QJE97898.1 hypothetical protein HHL09_19610 [Luteolibacter luteus]